MNKKRFGLGTLLIADAACAGVLGIVRQAYRVGQQAGFTRGLGSTMDQRLTASHVVTSELSIDDFRSKE